MFKNKKLFIGYLTGGDGGVSYSVDAGLALLEGGVDILEIGIPFSDPTADGPTIQKACVRALKKHSTTPDSILEIASRIHKEKPEAPLVLFSYFNPVLQGGSDFLKSAKKSGFSHSLLLDLPYDHPFYDEHHELDPVCLLSPASSDERVRNIARRGKGFLYYACQKGTTGVRSALPEDFESQLTRIRSLTKTPIAVGFGIADRQTAASALQHADAFVVGSAFVKMIEEGASPEQLKQAARNIDPRSYG